MPGGLSCCMGVRWRAGGSCCVPDLCRGRCALRVSVDSAGAVWVCAWLHQLPAWAAGCLIWAVWVCAACVRDAAGRSDRRCAGGAGRSVAGAAAGCGAANLCMISPGGVRWLRASERGPGACCGAARAGRLCGFGILPNKSLQRKGPCMYRAIACKSSVCINVCPACKC